MIDGEYLHYFNKRYVLPLEELKELPGGDGGFIAFMMGLAFYERLIRARLATDCKNSDDNNLFKKSIASDLGLTDTQTKDFWGSIIGSMSERRRTSSVS